MMQTKPVRSPWGAVQYCAQLADGIIEVSTAGHGGLHISRERLAAMPDALKLELTQRWFEEDCEHYLVRWAFATDLGYTAEQIEQISSAVRDWFPSQWEAFTGRVIDPGQSYVRDQELFQATHGGDFVVRAAWGGERVGFESIPDGMVGVTAQRAADHQDADFLVPDCDYEQRGRFGYVVPDGATVWQCVR